LIGKPVPTFPGHALATLVTIEKGSRLKKAPFANGAFEFVHRRSDWTSDRCKRDFIVLLASSGIPRSACAASPRTLSDRWPDRRTPCQNYQAAGPARSAAQLR